MATGNITLAKSAAMAAREWGKLSGLSESESMVYAGLFAVLCLFGALLFGLSPNIAAAASINTQLPGATLSATGLVLAAAVLFWAVFAPLIVLAGCKLPPLLLQMTGMLLLFAAWLAGLLMFAADIALLMAAILLVIIADAAAYLCGKLFGRTLMASSVSPGKTWEGFYGGFVAVLAAGFIGGSLIINAPPVWLLAAAFALMALSVIGDLFASFLKRLAGVKDSGAMLGAHGGVIDRLDAMLPVLPCAALLAGLPV